MDYLDPEEEFELLHAEELELMNELEDDFDPPEATWTKPKSKRSLDFGSTSKQNVHLDETNSGQRNSPKRDDVPQSACITDSEPLTTTDFSPSATSHKRRISDLFGDITDLEWEGESQDYSKKRKLGPEVAQDALIERIVQMRTENLGNSGERRSSIMIKENKKTEDCICAGAIPKWPFIPVSTGSQRVYLRYYSEQELCAKKESGSKFQPNSASLLGSSFSALKEMALNYIIQKNETTRLIDNGENIVDSDLWVDKYKPKSYIELLSDESTNRTLLHWLKLWDKAVFNKDVPVRKKKSFLPDKKELDDSGRPIHKVALLCGPPGLGKTTLAHMIAKHAGYSVVEVNASDDRSAESFRTQLEASTQMKSVLDHDSRPNCLILDEIDGAPQAAIDILVKFVSDKCVQKGKKAVKKITLKRPIICICNDLYVPALRPLRQIAFNVNFPSTSTAKLGSRLVEISRAEKIITDLGTMMALSEKSNNDIRSCLALLHCLKAKTGRVTLSQIQTSNFASKDIQLSLFSVWQKIFHIKVNRKGASSAEFSTLATQETKSMSGLRARINDVLRAVQSFGDYDRLALGIYENFLKLRPNESLSTMSQRTQRYSQILNFTLAGVSAHLRAYLNRQNLLLDVASFLIELITPTLRPVSVQLYSAKEKSELERAVKAMVDYNLTYTQERTPEGSYVFNLDPNLDELTGFREGKRERILGYATQQLISHEVDLERIRRTSMKTSSDPSHSKKGNDVEKVDTSAKVKNAPNGSPVAVKHTPNHLQKLTPKALKKKQETVARDFFGRVVEQTLDKVKEKAKTDEIVKSDIWFHFKEGYNNAVRKNVYMADLF